MKPYALALLLSLTAPGVHADSLFQHALDRRLLRWQKAHTELFVSACRTQQGTAVALYPIGHARGLLVEVDHNEVDDLAPFRIDARHAYARMDFMNTQGGEYVYAELQHHADVLLHLPYRLMPSSEAVLAVPPSGNCPYRPRQQ